MLSPPPPSKDMILGQAIDAAILSPESLGRDFIAGLDIPNRSNAQKAQHEAFRAEHAGKHVLKATEMDRIRDVTKSVWTNDQVKSLLGGRGSNQLAVVWDDESHGGRCKSLLDRLTLDWEGYPAIVDLKSAKDVSGKWFAKQIADLGYYIQAAMYLRGSFTIDPIPRRYYFIVAEKKPPYDCRVLRLEDDAIEQGTREVLRYLKRYSQAKESGVWPGTGNGWISIPTWAFDRSV